MWTALGLLVLALLFVDVFLTVFHAQGRPGPVTQVQNRALWRIFRWVATRGARGVRGGVLSFAAPTMVLVTLGSWVFLLTAGFAFIYYAWIPEFLVSPGQIRTHWVEAVYFSGYTAATLGFGDVVPDSEVLRLVAPVQALCGFALLSVSTMYLLSTYRELIQMRTAAWKIAAYFEAGGIHSADFREAGGYEAMARWSEDTSDLLMRSVQAHFQYPILHYFRPAKLDWSLPVQLGRLLDFREAGREAGDDEDAALTRRHPSFLALFSTVDQYLMEVSHHFVPGSGRRGKRAGNQDPRQTHDRLLRYMLYRW